MGTTSKLRRVRPGVPRKRVPLTEEVLTMLLIARYHGNRHNRRRAAVILRKEPPNALLL